MITIIKLKLQDFIPHTQSRKTSVKMTTSTRELSFNSDIDYTNIDDITASINACAFDIESLHETTSESISLQSKSTSSSL